MGAAISCDRPVAFADEPVSLGVGGVRPGAEVTMRLDATRGRSRWQSWARFRADERGGVALATQAPVAGSYAVADGMGLFWSLQNEDPLRAGVTLLDDDRDISAWLSAELDGVVVDRTHITRRFVGEGVVREELEIEGAPATIWCPERASGAVLVFNGSGGGQGRATAALLATRGFATMTIDFLHGRQRPVPLELFDDAIGLLGGRAGVGGVVGAVGISMGAQAALVLAARNSRVRAVVSYNGSHIATANPQGEDPVVGWWSQGGVPVPSVGPGSPAAAMESAVIRVEQSTAAYLLIAGGDDRIWSSLAMHRAVVERLREHAYRHPYQHLEFPSAGHMIGPPFLPYGAPEFEWDGGFRMPLGGSAEENARAAAESWPTVLGFLNEAIGDSAAHAKSTRVAQ